MSNSWLYPTGHRLEELRAARCWTCGHLLADHEQVGMVSGSSAYTQLRDGMQLEELRQIQIVSLCMACLSDPKGCRIKGLDRRGEPAVFQTAPQPQLRLVPR